MTDWVIIGVPSSAGAHHAGQERAPAALPRWATSPTTVIDRVGIRRMTIRQAIADSSCASSTIT